MKTIDLNAFPALSGVMDWGIVQAEFVITNR